VRVLSEAAANADSSKIRLATNGSELRQGFARDSCSARNSPAALLHRVSPFHNSLSASLQTSRLHFWQKPLPESPDSVRGYTPFQTSSEGATFNSTPTFSLSSHKEFGNCKGIPKRYFRKINVWPAEIVSYTRVHTSPGRGKKPNPSQQTKPKASHQPRTTLQCSLKHRNSTGGSPQVTPRFRALLTLPGQKSPSHPYGKGTRSSQWLLTKPCPILGKERTASTPITGMKAHQDDMSSLAQFHMLIFHFPRLFFSYNLFEIKFLFSFHLQIIMKRKKEQKLPVSSMQFPLPSNTTSPPYFFFLNNHSHYSLKKNKKINHV